MARRRSRLSRVGGALYVCACLTALAAGVWAFYQFILQPDTESLSIAYGQQREYTAEMLAPRWLGLVLLVPIIWLLRKWSLSDLPWLQQLLNATLRSLLIVALALAATDVVLTDYQSQVSTVVVVDVSESVPDTLLAAAQTYVQAVYEERGQNDVRLVTFARTARELPIAPGAERVPPITRHQEPGDGLESNLGAALRLAYGLFPQDHLKRVVVVSDGNLNRGDLLSEAYTAARHGVRIDAVALPFERQDEVLVQRVIFPHEITANEPFLIAVDVFSTYDGEIRLDLTQNEFRDIRGQRFEVQGGQVTQLEVRAEVYDPGRRTFEITIAGDRDGFADNNRYVHVVDVAGRPQVLYVEGESRRSTYLARALDDERNARVDFDLELRNARGVPGGLDEMAGFDLIILSDVEARYLSRAAMSALRSYVRDGGSFLMVGGENSFGPGGYQGTTIEEILPVTFEGRRRETMPSVALMLVIDRSGSMDGDKLEMAKDAARAAVELLGPQDQVGVIAFDTAPQQVVRLRSASNRLRIEGEIARITPGGGTDIYPALEEAYLELLGTRARIKHVILLTDGAAPYDGIAELASQMRSDRITVSTVGVGGDADRTLLEMIADISGGRFYYTNSAQAVPQIFVQETSQVTRTSLVEEPFRPRVVEGSTATAGIDFGAAPYLLGYVSTRAKSRATVGLETESGDPLYAYWRFGRGLAAVFTSDCKNRWMAEWIRQPLYPRFWAQVADHLMREPAHEEDKLGLVASVVDGRGRVTVDAIAEDDSFVNGLQSEVTITDPEGESQTIALAQTAAGRYEGDFELSTYGSYQIEAQHTLQGEDYAISLASLANPYPDEYLHIDDQQTLVHQAVDVSGGIIDPSTLQLFDPGEERIPSERRVWPYFVFAALGLLIVDILMRRVRLYGRTALDWGKLTS